EQPIPLPQLADLGSFGAGLAGLRALVDVGAPHPLLQRHRVHPEVSRDLPDRHSGLAVTRDAHDVISELGGIGLGHSNILPGRPPGQARSDVTYSCSSPTVWPSAVTVSTT